MMENIVNNDDRNSIIVNNFFKYLKEKNISNVQYAKDNFIDKSLLTQWKTGKTKMTMEHVYKASIYLNVYVNDLVYSDDEKKEIDVLSNREYNPLIAQKIVDFRDRRIGFKKPQYIILCLFMVMLAVFFYISLYNEIKNNYFLYFIFIIPIIIITAVYFIGHKKKIICNYLDDVYFMIEDVNNKYKHYIKINIITSLIFNFIIFFLTFYLDEFFNGSILFLIASNFLLNYIALFCSLHYLKKPFFSKIRKDDDGYDLYIFILLSMVVSAQVLVFGLCVLFYGFKYSVYYIIASLIIFILSMINFILVSKKYSEYKLVYDEYNKGITYLK